MASFGAAASNKARAIEALDLLCNQPLTAENLDRIKAIFHPRFCIVHAGDDDPAPDGRDAWLGRLVKRREQLAHFHMEIRDAVAEGDKVWVFAKLTGLSGGAAKMSVDMMTVDADGLIVECQDVERLIEGQ